MSRVLPVLLILACGGSQTPSATPDRCADDPSACGEEAAEAGPWDALEGQALRDYVKDAAWAKIAELQPAVTPEALAGWLETPASAPPLAGRTVERLFDLAAVALAGGDLDRAEGIVRLVRSAARNRNSAFAGNTLLSEVARRRADSPDAMEASVAAVLRELPASRFGSATVIFQVFQSAEQVSARLAQTHQQLVSLDTAGTALYFEQILPAIVTHRERFLGAIATVRAELDAQPERAPYAFGTVDLEGARDAREVRMAVWDVGTNPALFEDQLLVNEAETLNGEDDDGNGRVDDRHGIVQDVGDVSDADLLFEPSPETLAEYKPFLRGIMDLRAGLASTEAAQQVLGLMRGATSPEALEALEVNLDAVGEWAHGTHVAGIMVQGLPQARLAIFRSAWAGEARLYHRRGPTDAELAAERANVEAIAAFIQRHEIRVVNASLGFGEDYVASQLRYESETYADDAAVLARAAEVHRHRAETWRAVFEACPDTLFVVAAGNSNQDVSEYDVVPASFDHANVLVVGALDRWGEWATFTNSNPERVRVFDFGVEVPSLVPDGETVPLSGTSMASPNVANLAGKVLAVNPELTPSEVITLIEETGDAIPAPFGGVIANETQAVARARRER
ncbi:MAG: S8 family serine peptidase [Myxococcota bacterium]